MKHNHSKTRKTTLSLIVIFHPQYNALDAGKRNMKRTYKPCKPQPGHVCSASKSNAINMNRDRHAARKRHGIEMPVTPAHDKII